MSDSTIAQGLAILGLPPLTDTGPLRERLEELLGPVSSHEGFSGGTAQAQQGAAVNQGVAADTSNAFVEGLMGDINDLQQRLAVTTNNMATAGNAVEWGNAALGFLAVAACTAVYIVATNPAIGARLLARLKALANKVMINLVKMRQLVGRIFGALIRQEARPSSSLEAQVVRSRIPLGRADAAVGRAGRKVQGIEDRMAATGASSPEDAAYYAGQLNRAGRPLNTARQHLDDAQRRVDDAWRSARVPEEGPLPANVANLERTSHDVSAVRRQEQALQEHVSKRVAETTDEQWGRMDPEEFLAYYNGRTPPSAFG
ncbi:hypothetical protein [Nonomuraea sp. NPDC049158]|uniref:hypothetical protein n=1 Tax=Nonomuraea sp. NPDC049158 TaxID=3155649 RepID=UPI0033EB9865